MTDAQAPEPRWPWIVGLTLLLGLPVLWAWLFPPPGWVVYRNFAYSGDYTQYRSALMQGYDGAWLISNHFTPEAHQPILQYPFYVFLGHLARWLAAPIEALYVLASLAAGVALWYALVEWGRTFLPATHARLWALAFAFTVGPAWLIEIVQKLLPGLAFSARYVDAFNRVEVNTLLLFCAAPHLPLALALLLITMVRFYRRGDTPPLSWRDFLYDALAVIALALLNPFSLPTLLIGAGMWWLVRCFQARRLHVRPALSVLGMGLAAAPFVLYNLWAFTRDPFWGQAYGSQNLQVSYAPDVVLVGYGVMGLLAIIGGWRQRREPAAQFLSLWSITLLALSYLPLSYQRRFGFGVAPALNILAVWGGEWVLQQPVMGRLWARRPLRLAAQTLLVLLLWGQNLIYYTVYTASYAGAGPTPRYMFQPLALKAAARFLDADGGAKVVALTCEELGNLLAGEIHGRVVLGHAGATLDVAARRRETQAFFSGQMTVEAQRAYLARHGVTHLLTSALSPLQCGDPYIPPPEWELAFEQAGIRLYRKME